MRVFFFPRQGPFPLYPRYDHLDLFALFSPSLERLIETIFLFRRDDFLFCTWDSPSKCFFFSFPLSSAIRSAPPWRCPGVFFLPSQGVSPALFLLHGNPPGRNPGLGDDLPFFLCPQHRGAFLLLFSPLRFSPRPFQASPTSVSPLRSVLKTLLFSLSPLQDLTDAREHVLFGAVRVEGADFRTPTRATLSLPRQVIIFGFSPFPDALSEDQE